MLEKFLVCLDGSAPAEQIIPYITKEALAMHSKIILLRVIDLPEGIISLNIPGTPAVPVSTPAAVKHTIMAEKEANDYLKRKSRSLKAKGLDVDCIIQSGSAGQTIVKYAQENGLNRKRWLLPLAEKVSLMLAIFRCPRLYHGLRL